MDAFVWNNRFTTGITSVDSQHRHLVDIINRVGDVLIDPHPVEKAAVEGIFHELADYANTHFLNEEQLMQDAGVNAAHFRHHHKIHRNFVAQVKAMWQARGIMNAPAETLHGFLSAWLTSHILDEDQEMARQIRACQGESAPAVTLSADTRSTDVLLQALHNLYGVLSHVNIDLMHANTSLEAEVALRTQELTETNRQLQTEQAQLAAMLKKVTETQSQLLQAEKMASIGQLAAGVAHEINNPIGFVNSNLGTLAHYVDSLIQLADLGAATPAGQALATEVGLDFIRQDVRDLLRESQDGVERVRKIVANLKDFSHFGQQEWQEADLLAGLESTINVAWHEIKYKAEIVRELHPLPRVRCVPAQINQVFMNLLVNAAQAIAQRGTITLRSGSADGWVWIEVADTGCGMDETTRQRIFEPFFTTKPVGTGTGLGMSVTYDIITKHGGRLDIDSTVGRGTCMRIRLPVDGPPIDEES